MVVASSGRVGTGSTSVVVTAFVSGGRFVGVCHIIKTNFFFFKRKQVIQGLKIRVCRN